MTNLTNNPLLANYTNIEQVGVGGMGEVYKAFDEVHKRTIAIKRFYAPLSQKRLEARERLLREAKVSFEFNHPNLASIYEVIDTEDELFIIRPFYEGMGLDEKLKEGPLEKEVACKIFLDLCNGLEHAHSKNIFHRDIKPANIFILENGNSVLMDFGLAKATSLFHEGLTQTGSIVGTLDYLSPERVKGLDNDHRSDIWALGVVLFEMLTGEKPFGKNQEISASILKIITSPTPSISDFGGPEELELIIYKTLAKNLEKRYQNLSELKHDLELVESGQSLSYDSTISLQTDLPLAFDQDFDQNEVFVPIANNLPKSAKQFVGRENELKLINYYLATDESRLVTIVGSGGNGKTGLALEVAQQQCSLPNFLDGIYFVGLESVSSPIAIPSAIAEALNFDFSGIENPTHQLINYLSTKNTLLVFDNTDHLTKDLSIILELITSCSKVKILCTSRTKLGFDAEWLVYLNGLSLPQADDSLTLELAKKYDSIRLFEKRARRNKASFVLLDNNLKDVIEICQIVQGSPLGIELAASWIRLLSPDRILKEVQKNFDFLESHELSGKHKSMRAVFEYSWNLLSHAQQDRLVRLTIFHGGFNLEAVKAVTGSNQRDILDLVDASLLQEATDDVFDLQPLVKQYAREKIEESTDLKFATEEKHCNHYLEQVAEYKEAIRSKDQEKCIKSIESTIENIMAAWHWSIDNQYKTQTLVPVTEVLRRFFVEKARFAEAINLFEDTLVSTYSNSKLQQLSGHVKAHLGCIKLYTNESTVAAKLSKDSIQDLKTLKDYQGMMLPINTLGALEAEKGNYNGAKNYFRHCVKIARHLSDIEEATHLANLAMAEQYSGDYQNSAMNYQNALDLARKYRLTNLELNITNNLGHLMLATKQTPAAIQLLNDSLELANTIGSTHILPNTYTNLGIAYFHLTEYKKSLDYKLEALKHIQKNGRKDMETEIYAEIGRSLLFNNNLIEAAKNIRHSILLGYESENVRDSLKALIFWSQYLIVNNQKDEAIQILYFVCSSKGMTEEDETEAKKLLKVLCKRFSEKDRIQFKQGAEQFELEPLLKSIVKDKSEIPFQRTIDSTQLTTSL